MELFPECRLASSPLTKILQRFPKDFKKQTNLTSLRTTLPGPTLLLQLPSLFLHHRAFCSCCSQNGASGSRALVPTYTTHTSLTILLELQDFQGCTLRAALLLPSATPGEPDPHHCVPFSITAADRCSSWGISGPFLTLLNWVHIKQLLNIRKLTYSAHLQTSVMLQITLAWVPDLCDDSKISTFSQFSLLTFSCVMCSSLFFNELHMLLSIYFYIKSALGCRFLSGKVVLFSQVHISGQPNRE